MTPSREWRNLMAFGLGVLRLAPEAFWSMTPREFECAAAPWLAAMPDTPGPRELAALMRAYPDTITPITRQETSPNDR